MRDLSPQVLSEWDEFTTDHLKEKEQAAFHARKSAIIAVARGMSMASAALMRISPEIGSTVSEFFLFKFIIFSLFLWLMLALSRFWL